MPCLSCKAPLALGPQSCLRVRIRDLTTCARAASHCANRKSLPPTLFSFTAYCSAKSNMIHFSGLRLPCKAEAVLACIKLLCLVLDTVTTAPVLFDSHNTYRGHAFQTSNKNTVCAFDLSATHHILELCQFRFRRR